MRYSVSQPGFTWIKSNDGAIPPNAVQGGRESNGQPLYICRQFHKGGLHIGKAGPHLKGCYIPYGDKEHFYKEYFVLCGNASQLRWIENRGQCTPRGWSPLEAGNEEDGTELFVGKFPHSGGEQIGKVHPDWGHGLTFGYGGKEQSVPEGQSYYVLATL